MIAKKPIKLTPKKISSWLTVIIILITSVVLIFVSIFLYNNFYQTITQSKKIIVLQGRVALYTVDIEKFNSIIDELAKKTLPKIIDRLASPFR